MPYQNCSIWVTLQNGCTIWKEGGAKMALGTNYKRTEGPNHPIARQIKAHQKRMEELVEAGYSKDDASKMAFKEIKNGTLKY
jgi:hypothetical protein